MSMVALMDRWNALTGQQRKRAVASFAFVILLTLNVVDRSALSLSQSHMSLPDVYVRKLEASAGGGEKNAGNLRADAKDDRPVMHTFFHRIDVSMTKTGRKNTGMSDDGDMAMIEAWKKAWEAAGWQTKVLSLKEASTHPEFKAFNDTLHELPFGRAFAEYDILCFLRWLAMVQVGGGWMSDYDTFPLNPLQKRGHHLPNGGRFTAYERIPRGAVPSLVSGTAKEWNRMAHRLLRNTIEHTKETFWSDFYALIDLHLTDPDSYEVNDGVIGGRYVLTGESWDKVKDCEMTSGKLAVHFSHDAIQKGKLREGEGMNDRPRIAQRFLTMWAEKCDLKPVPEEKGPTVEKPTYWKA